MRYIEDFLPSLLLLAILGFWQGYQRLQQRLGWRRLYGAAAVILATASILISLLAALSVNNARFGVIDLLRALSH